MGKKLKLFVIVIAFIVIGILGYIFLGNRYENEDIDLGALSEQINEIGRFDDILMMEIDKKTLSQLFSINEEDIIEVYGKMPITNVQSSLYLVIKTEKQKEVKEKLEEYGNSYEERWSTYLAEQYEFVKNRKIGINGNIVYFLVAEDVEELEKLVK